MAFKSKLAAFSMALVLTGSVFASQQSPCPDLNDIKAEGISMAEEMGPNRFISYNISSYNTESNWGFIIAPIESDSEDDAINTANEILDSMSAPGVVGQESGIYYCSYETGQQGVFAAAVKGDGAGQISPMKLKQAIKAIH